MMMTSKTKYHDQEEQQEALDEKECQSNEQGEQDRLTDDMHREYFEDDKNKAERFTDDYHENFTD